MDKDSRDKRFIRKPIFRGGNKEFSKFITANLKYPAAALEAKIEGTVRVKYDIDNKGDVIKTKVLSSVGHGCDEEAVRVIKLLKFDIPKGPRKLKIIFHRTTKIKFAIPIVEKKVAKPSPKQLVEKDKQLVEKDKQGANLSYQYTNKSKNKKQKEDKKAQQTYNYTVSW